MIRQTLEIWLEELKTLFKDQGTILFCLILPLTYPILYSWIYNNEVVREVPVIVVDDSHSALSREFIQKFDASPDVSVAFQAGSIQEGKDLIGHGEAYGILYFPHDFGIKAGRHEQAFVSVYCDMSYMLTYKAIFQTATAVSGLLGDEIKTQMAGNYTSREEEITNKPLDYEEVPIFNVTAGYGNFILPGVLILVIQQAMFLAVGLLAGTDRERNFRSIRGVVPTLLGKGLAYFMIFFVMLSYTTLAVPRFFGFVMMMHLYDWVLFMIPFILSCVFFAIVMSDFVRYRENVMLIVVFTSVPMLFLSGISWPQSALPKLWSAIADFIPSTFGIRGFVRMSSMGARIGDVLPEVRSLWIQVVAYGFLAALVIYRRRIKKAQLAGEE